MEYKQIESILISIGMGFLSIAFFFITFLFIIGTIFTMIEKKKVHIFDDTETVMTNGTIAYLLFIALLIVGAMFWFIGFIVQGGSITY